jgi:hypothetical protein
MKKSASTARLEQKVKRLSTLIEVNALISSTLNLDQILENMMAISKQVMNADASSLMLIDERSCSGEIPQNHDPEPSGSVCEHQDDDIEQR